MSVDLTGDADAPAVPHQPCLRANECSQQQLVRLVGYRNPLVPGHPTSHSMPLAMSKASDDFVIT